MACCLETAVARVARHARIWRRRANYRVLSRRASSVDRRLAVFVNACASTEFSVQGNGAHSAQAAGTSPSISQRWEKPFFSQSDLDRAAELRDDPQWLAEAVQSESAKFIPLFGEKSALRHRGSTASPVILDADAFKRIADSQSEFPEDTKLQDVLFDREGVEIDSLKVIGRHLHDEDAGMLAISQGLAAWQIRNRFCNRCGHKLSLSESGWVAKCVRNEGGCGSSTYPRLDPAVIMLVQSSQGEYTLLGHNKKWQRGRFSLLAGFCEIAETLEAAVCREVYEEAGVRVCERSVQYAASQPWPFPQSLMLGFQARVHSQPESVPASNFEPPPPSPYRDNSEVTSSEWFHFDYLAEALGYAGPEVKSKPCILEPFSLPGQSSLSHHLLTSFVRFYIDKENYVRPISLALENNKDTAFGLVRAVSQNNREEYFIRAKDESQALFLRLNTLAYRQIEAVGTGIIRFVQLLEAENSADIQENRRSCTEITCRLELPPSALPSESQRIEGDVQILLKRMFPLYRCTLKLEFTDKEENSVT